MEKINIVNIVKRELSKNHVSPAELARQLNAHPSTVHGMLSRDTLQVGKLISLSSILQYNFFKEIGQMLPYEKPEENKNKETESALKERIKELEIENTILRRTLKDILKG